MTLASNRAGIVVVRTWSRTETQSPSSSSVRVAKFFEQNLDSGGRALRRASRAGPRSSPAGGAGTSVSRPSPALSFTVSLKKILPRQPAPCGLDDHLRARKALGVEIRRELESATARRSSPVRASSLDPRVSP